MGEGISTSEYPSPSQLLHFVEIGLISSPEQLNNPSASPTGLITMYDAQNLVDKWEQLA